MAPKYNHETYRLGTYYPGWSAERQEVIDQAMNKISTTSPAGVVLKGDGKEKQLFLSNAETHTGTDNAGLAHVNFVIKTLGVGGHQTGECHLYPDGRYTDGAGPRANSYPGNPSGGVVKPEEAAKKPPTDDDFPPLGGGKK